MKTKQTSLLGALITETLIVADHRGAFSRFYCGQELASIIRDRQIVQINHSRTTTAGAIRGLHFQHPPHAEMKLVRCIKGRAWDVIVDLRADSPTFLKWHSEELSADNANMLIIPEGCAHGFQTLEAEVELLYLHTEAYAPEAEDGIRYDDPAIAIDWPLPVTDLSTRDRKFPFIDSDFQGLEL